MPDNGCGNCRLKAKILKEQPSFELRKKYLKICQKCEFSTKDNSKNKHTNGLTHLSTCTINNLFISEIIKYRGKSCPLGLFKTDQ